MCIHVKSWEKGRVVAITRKQWKDANATYGCNFDKVCFRCGKGFGSGGYTVGMQFFCSYFCTKRCAKDFSDRLAEMFAAASRESKMVVD